MADTASTLIPGVRLKVTTEFTTDLELEQPVTITATNRVSAMAAGGRCDGFVASKRSGKGNLGSVDFMFYSGMREDRVKTAVTAGTYFKYDGFDATSKEPVVIPATGRADSDGVVLVGGAAGTLAKVLVGRG